MGDSRHWRPYGRKPVRNRRDDALSRMDPLKFENLMAKYFRRQGYAVVEVGTGGRRSRYDGGIDLKLFRDGQCTVVQCKRENAYQVTHNVMHELLGVMLTEGAAAAIVVNTGEFTRAAWEKAANEPRIKLIDGDQLRKMLASELGSGPSSESQWAPRQEPAWGADPSVAGERAPDPVRVRSYGRSTAPAVDLNTIKLAAAMLGLVLLVGWQCSRGEYSMRRPRPAPAEATTRLPVASPAPPSPEMVEAPRRPVIVETPAPPDMRREPTAEELRRAGKRADEAMKIIEATTPEM